MYLRVLSSRRLCLGALGFALLLVSQASLAADKSGNYAIWGVGRASCHQYLKSLDATVDERYKLYLFGYLTAFNTLSADTYNVTAATPLTTTLENISAYCEDHQMDSFDRAIQQVIDRAFESRHRVPPGRERGWGRAAPPKKATSPEQSTP